MTSLTAQNTSICLNNRIEMSCNTTTNSSTPGPASTNFAGYVEIGFSLLIFYYLRLLLSVFDPSAFQLKLSRAFLFVCCVFKVVLLLLGTPLLSC